MKRKNNLLILTLLLNMFSAKVMAYDAIVDGIYYNLHLYGTYFYAEVTCFYNDDAYIGHVIIPEKITYAEKQYPVTCIGNDAFSGCTGLTSVTIPNSMTSIGTGAFYGCSNLTAVHITDLEAWCNIKFEDNPLYYAHHLFLNGDEISDLIIPNSITSIGQYTFTGCAMASVTIPNSVTRIGDYAFQNCI